LEGEVISKERSSTERSFQADGPTTEKAFRCIIAKRAEDAYVATIRINQIMLPDQLPGIPYEVYNSTGELY